MIVIFIKFYNNSDNNILRVKKSNSNSTTYFKIEPMLRSSVNLLVRFRTVSVTSQSASNFDSAFLVFTALCIIYKNCV